MAEGRTHTLRGQAAYPGAELTRGVDEGEPSLYRLVVLHDGGIPRTSGGLGIRVIHMTKASVSSSMYGSVREKNHRAST